MKRAETQNQGEEEEEEEGGSNACSCWQRR
jgi:hypothetical protein